MLTFQRMLKMGRCVKSFSTRTFLSSRSARFRSFAIAGSGTIATGGLALAQCKAWTDSCSGIVDIVSMDEVSKHCTKDDAWIVIDGKVYDITSWIPYHPGGCKILEAHAGKDVSRQWHSLKHSETALKLLSGLYIADVEKYKPPAAEQEKNAIVPSKSGKPRMVIIGAGICGVASAYFLSQEGKYDITVLDKSHLVGGTALASSAILFLGGLVEKEDLSKANLMTWSGQWQFELMKSMQAEWEDVDFKERGTMGVIQTEEQLAYLQKHLAPGGRMHGKMELLSREEMLRREPDLSPSLLGATLVPQGATFDPFLVCNAFAKRAKSNGVSFLHGREVTAVRTDGQPTIAENGLPPTISAEGVSVRAACAGEGDAAAADMQEGVGRRRGGGGEGGGAKYEVECVSEDGRRERVEADVVLVCNGWQANQVLGEVGVHVPVRGVQGQMFATHHPGVSLSHNLYSWEGPHFWASNPQIGHQDTLDPEDGHRITRHLYGLQISNGTLKFGGDRITCQSDADNSVIAEGIQQTARHVGEVIPALRGCEVVGAWSGVMPFVKDQKPLIGELKPGLWVLTGAPFTKGASYAKLLSEFVVGDDTHAHLKLEVSPHRFSKQA